MRFLSLALIFAATPVWASDVTVTFTPEEAQVLINDLDLATKAGGLSVAVGALQIVKKVQDAANKPIEPSKPLPEPEKKP